MPNGKSSAIDFVYDDGGRAAAGFKGDTGDCVTRAIAIVTNMPYREVYDLVNSTPEAVKHRGARPSSARTGVHKATTRRILANLGWAWTPTMAIGSGCTMHVRTDELPEGRIILQLSKHLSAVIDGVLHDTDDCSRDGTRCVYGFWKRSDR